MVTKKQHYVPQLLLRRFSIESAGAAKVNLYDIDRCQFRANQNIKDVCSGNYTYDKDNSFEDFLSRNVEAPAALALNEILEMPNNVSKVPSSKILQFMLVQLARTRQAYQSNMDAINSMMKTVFMQTAKLNNLDPEDASRLRIEPKEPRSVLTYITAYAATQYQLLADLSICIVVNNTDQEFILSDHPVFQHNWYLRDSQEVLRNSITVHGVQFFMPISPTTCICLYDSNIYAYRGTLKGAAIIATPQDVAVLNTFQALGADSLLLARSESMAATLKLLGKQYGNKRAFTAVGSNSEPIDAGDGKLRSTHMVVREQTAIATMPSFVKVKNKVRRKPSVCSHRNIQAVLDHKAMDDEMDRRRLAP